MEGYKVVILCALAFSIALARGPVVSAIRDIKNWATEAHEE